MIRLIFQKNKKKKEEKERKEKAYVFTFCDDFHIECFVADFLRRTASTLDESYINHIYNNNIMFASIKILSDCLADYHVTMLTQPAVFVSIDLVTSLLFNVFDFSIHRLISVRRQIQRSKLVDNLTARRMGGEWR